MDGLRESLRTVKKDVKGVAQASKTWVKSNVVEPVQDLLGLGEGAKRRKGQVEEFFNDLGEGDDLHSLSQLLADNLAERSSVDIVDINAEAGKHRRTARGPRAYAGPRASTRTPGEKQDSWIKRMAKKSPIFARCTNKEAVDDDDTFGDSHSSGDDYTDYDPESRSQHAMRSEQDSDEEEPQSRSRISQTMQLRAQLEHGEDKENEEAMSGDIDFEEDDDTFRAFRGFGRMAANVVTPSVSFADVSEGGARGAPGAQQQPEISFGALPTLSRPRPPGRPRRDGAHVHGTGAGIGEEQEQEEGDGGDRQSEALYDKREGMPSNLHSTALH